MNENLIPASIVDLVKKYIAAKDINEKTALEMRLNDVMEYVQAALNQGRKYQLRVK